MTKKTTSAVGSISKDAPSIERRIDLAYRKLTILIGLFGASGSDHDLSEFDGEMKDAIRQELDDAHEALYWVRRLPGVVLTLPAPDDDDIIGINRIPNGKLDEVIETGVRERLHQNLQKGGAK